MPRKVNVLELIEKGEVLTAHATGSVLRLRKIGAPDENLKLLSLTAEVADPPAPKAAPIEEKKSDKKK
jgi:hypothetical protein